MGLNSKFAEDFSQAENRIERAILVGLCTDSMMESDFDLSMLELKELAKACDMEVLFYLSQNLSAVNKATYIGSGKVDEVRQEVQDNQADIVIFNDSLSPMQLRNLQRELKVPILDRTLLILEIFSKRARTREAKIQVEAARLQYMLPRLVGLHENLNRQGGASGSLSNKGAGEKKIDLDKRHLEQRLSELRNELKKIELQRQTQKKKRKESMIPRIALVGYTNSGKSTLMNAMIELYCKESKDFADKKMVFEENMLFATLDTTVRKISPDNRFPFLLSDTVGFVSNLPHDLVKSFCATLEEVNEADLLLHVVDVSDVNHNEQIEVTRKVLKQLDAGAIPVVYVNNKADLSFVKDHLPVIKENKIFLSAKNRVGMDDLLDLIEQQLSTMYKQFQLLLPFDKGELLSYFKENARIFSVAYEPEGIYVDLLLRNEEINNYSKYFVKTENK